MFRFNKIIVIGCCGAGKSTFSKRLSAITGIPLYHLDNIYWRHDKSHLDARTFLKKQRQIMKSDRWIIDGNYGKTMKYRIKKCDLICFFDLPADVCLDGIMHRQKNRNDIACELEPNEEFIDFVKSYREKTRPTVLKRIKKHKNKTVVCFNTHKEADDFLERINQ